MVFLDDPQRMFATASKKEEASVFGIDGHELRARKGAC